MTGGYGSSPIDPDDRRVSFLNIALSGTGRAAIYVRTVPDVPEVLPDRNIALHYRSREQDGHFTANILLVNNERSRTLLYREVNIVRAGLLCIRAYHSRLTICSALCAGESSVQLALNRNDSERAQQRWLRLSSEREPRSTGYPG